ncbi:MAG TPA: SDR family oxidoreductase [Chloroflexota bacterium]|nr:SDR family oxidoreductase [Chloroflexota bacterium]
MTQLQNKVALITGGGSGIGRATAVLFAQEGANVAVADVNLDTAEETVAMITDGGGQAFAFQADVSRADDVQAMVGEVVARYGRLDCAFNNAGIEGLPTRTMDVSEDDFDRIIAVNLKGVWLCLKYELEQMVAQGGGAIVNTASVAGLTGAHSMPAYAASKHGVVGLTRTAAVEYGRKNIRINAVCPSVIETPMVSRGFEAFPQFLEATIRINPMRRLGQADEVARAVLWLCSDAASFTNGAALTIDGGFTAQ